MKDDKKNQTDIARSIVQNASTEEKEALLHWAEGLLLIRSKDLPVLKKAWEAIKLTKKSKVITPILKRIVTELKRIGWDERSWKARLGIGSVVATLATVGNTGAGIAALGSAIGVPLWIVIGAGATFAGTIVDEIKSKSKK